MMGNEDTGMGNVLTAGQPRGAGAGGGGAAVVGDWKQQLITFAQLNVHPSIDSMPLDSDLEKNDATLGGGAAAAFLAANNMLAFNGGLGGTGQVTGGQSGIVLLSTNGIGSANITNAGGLAGNGTVIDVASARAWMLAIRLQLRTIPAATTRLWMSLLNLNGADKFIGIRPANDAAHIVYGVDDGAGLVSIQSTTQAIPVDGLYHWLILGFYPAPTLTTDGPLMAFFDMNPTPIGSFLPPAGYIEANTQIWRAHIDDTAALAQIHIDKLAVLTNSA